MPTNVQLTIGHQSGEKLRTSSYATHIKGAVLTHILVSDKKWSQDRYRQPATLSSNLTIHIGHEIELT